MKKFLIVLTLPLLFVRCSDDEQPTGNFIDKSAVATIFSVSSEDGETFETGDQVGHASFNYINGITNLTVRVSGMEPNTAHAMHLHQGTLEEPGRHWNKDRFIAFCDSLSMGRVWLKPFAGDVGNIQVDEEGNGEFTLSTDLWSVGTEDRSDVLGTVLFIHHKSEDFANECDPNHKHDGGGHSNKKIAGGTVVLAPIVID